MDEVQADMMLDALNGGLGIVPASGPMAVAMKTMVAAGWVVIDPAKPHSFDVTPDGARALVQAGRLKVSFLAAGADRMLERLLAWKRWVEAQPDNYPDGDWDFVSSRCPFQAAEAAVLERAGKIERKTRPDGFMLARALEG